MKKLAVIPSDSIRAYLDAGCDKDWLRQYYNPGRLFDEVYLLSPLEKDDPDLLGMTAIRTEGRHLRKTIRRLNIDVVRAYGGYWACDMACNNKVENVPVVVSVHDTNPRKLHDSIRYADIVFSMSTIVNRIVLEKFSRGENAWILPNRVSFDQMRPYPRQECADLDNKYPFKYKIIHVGRKTRQKNLDTLLKALKILGEDYCLLAVGKGKADEFENLAKDACIRERCFFIDAISNNELARYYSWADCMCTPSRWEGFGIVFIEALACRSVVVTSDIAPMNEYIKHMRNGLLVKEYEDPHALAVMIKIACCDDMVRKTLKDNSRESIANFEKNRVDTMEADYYRTVLRMKDDGEFGVGLPARVARAFKDLAKNFGHALLKPEVA